MLPEPLSSKSTTDSAPAQVDTGAIERLVASRMDTMEDSMKAMEIRLLEMIPQLAQVVASSSGNNEESNEDGDDQSKSDDADNDSICGLHDFLWYAVLSGFFVSYTLGSLASLILVYTIRNDFPVLSFITVMILIIPSELKFSIILPFIP